MSELKGYRMTGELAENRLRGAAAVMGNLDRDYDVILPGAFRKALPEFLKSGFVTDTHSWQFGQTVAMPVAAREDGNRLMVEAEFHSDTASQEVRQKVAERISAGLAVGLSVGFSTDPSGWTEYPNGKDMLKDMDARGVDQSLLDTAAIRRRTNWCRAISEIAELYEFSIVPVPANPLAQVTAVKHRYAGALPATVREFEGFLRDAGFSRADATAIASHGFKGALPREAGGGDAEGELDTGLLLGARVALEQFRATLIGG